MRATADSEISAILTASSRNACTRRRGSSAIYPQKTVLRYKIRNLCRLLRSECTPQEEKSGHISSAQPIGMAIQIPATPSAVAEKRYASATRMPSEMTVRTTDISARLTAR